MSEARIVNKKKEAILNFIRYNGEVNQKNILEYCGRTMPNENALGLLSELLQEGDAFISSSEVLWRASK